MNLKKLCYRVRFPLFLTAITFCIALRANAQQVKFSFKDTPVKIILKEITLRTGYNFVYANALKELENKMDFSYEAGTFSIQTVLTKLFSGTGLTFVIKGKQVVLNRKEVMPQEQSLVGGIVTDRNRDPLAGVMVVNGRTGKWSYTDADGRYYIEAGEGDELLFSCIGLSADKHIVGSLSKQMEIRMDYDEIELEDVVVIGYGNKDRKSITSSIVSVKKEDLEKLSNTAATMDDLLTGTVKGVLSVQTSGEPGAASRINVRGITSPYPNMMGDKNSNVPLYVIDGVPMFLDNRNINPLINISPGDIESIDILKDASATAIYGSRGANGVIIVKTKGGKKGENMHIDFGYNISFSNPVKVHKPLNRAEFMEHTDMLLKATVVASNEGRSSASGLYMQGQLDPSFPDILGKFGLLSMDMITTKMSYNGLNEAALGKENINWSDVIANKNAVTHNYNVGLRGSTEDITYSVSLHGANQEGLYKNDKLNHYGIRVTLDAQLAQRVKVGTVLNNSFSKKISGKNSSSEVGAWRVRPDLPVYTETGALNRIDDSPFYRTEAWGPNPLATRKINNTTKANQFIGNLYAVVDLVKGLSFRTDFSLSYYKFDTNRFIPQIAQIKGPHFSSVSKLFMEDSGSYNTSLNFRLDYILNKGSHSFNTMLGYGSDRELSKSKNFDYEGFPNDEHMQNMGSAQSLVGYLDYVSKGGLNSVYSRISYGYDNRYLAEVTVRADESSKFGPENRWGFFPALSLGWLMSNENFLKDSRNVDNMKLRFSIGKTGSTNVSDFSYRQFLEKDSNGQYGSNMTISLKDLLPNKGIGWEMTTEYNAGYDFSFFNGRLYGSIDAYYRKTDGALAPSPHILESGMTNYYSNLIDMSNKGMEFALGGDIIRSKTFLWNSNLNISFNRSKIEKLNGAFITTYMQDAFIEGKSMGTIKGYVVEKIFRSREEVEEMNAKAKEKGFDAYQPASGPGDYKMKDLDGDGTITQNDRTVIANPEPKFFGGWMNTLSYKNFTLSFLMQFSYGGEALYTELMDEATGLLGQSVSREMFRNTWTPQNPDARYAQLVFASLNPFNRVSSNRFVFKTSYLRMKNISLSYNLPESLLYKLRLCGAQVYFSASNLFLLSSWPGIDPELLGTDMSVGMGNDAYPLGRSFTFGVKFRF